MIRIHFGNAVCMGSICLLIWVSSCLGADGTDVDVSLAVSTCETTCEDEIWLLSAREFDGCSEPCADCLQCQRYCGGQWAETAIEDFFQIQQNATGKTPVIFVHGYQTNLENAELRGIQVYQNLFGGVRQSGPIRFVIWAWKSEKETHRPVQDFNLKSQRAIALGDIFSATLNQFGTTPPVVIGYSLGAQVVVSALAQSSVYVGPPVQLAIIAAATDCGFASCYGEMSQCGHVQRSFIFCNSGDRALRAAKWVCRVTHGTRFESFESLAASHEAQLGEVQIIDITSMSSRRHSIVRYSAIPLVRSCIEELVLSNGPSPVEIGTAPVGNNEKDALATRPVAAEVETQPHQSADPLSQGGAFKN